MEEILHQLIGGLSRYLQDINGFYNVTVVLTYLSFLLSTKLITIFVSTYLDDFREAHVRPDARMQQEDKSKLQARLGVFFHFYCHNLANMMQFVYTK